MKSTKIALFSMVALFFVTVTACDTNASQQNNTTEATSTPEITEAMVLEAQQAWIRALVSIGEAEDPQARANEVLTNYYDYDNGSVLFKPTLAYGDLTFRPTKEGALSYFVGGNDDFAQDGGFALRPYVSGEVEMGGVVSFGDVAIAMSNITLTAADGSTVMVNKTFAYRMDDEGNMRIITHHSSLPFSPN